MVPLLQSVSDFVWNLICGPLSVVCSVVLYGFHDMTGASLGVSIIALSLAMSSVMFAFGVLSDGFAKRYAYVSRWSSHIREHFHGDERAFRLGFFWRQVGYGKALAAELSSIVTICLQAPCFLAAYRFLSEAVDMSGESLLLVSDLSRPDGLLHIAGASVNVLPFLMLVANVAYIMVWTRGKAARERVLTLALAVAFFVWLYASPSALVLYWTCNQVFSLLFCVLRSRLGAVARRVSKHVSPLIETVPDFGLPCYAIMCVALALFFGVFQPAWVISTQPSSFTFVPQGFHIWHSMSIVTPLSFGWFALWPSVIYWVVSDHARDVLRRCVPVLGMAAFVFVFWMDEAYVVWFSAVMFAGIAGAIFLGVACLGRRGKSVVLTVVTCALVLSVCGSVYSGSKCFAYDWSKFNAAQVQSEIFLDEDDEDGIRDLWHLSTDERNVVVIFSDRAISQYVEETVMANEDLKSSFDGFTFYPNTLSYGTNTVVATPSMFGGHEYHPYLINARDKESMRSKHNEALLVLPRLFDDAGYRVTLSNMPYAGDYSWEGNMDVFDRLGGVTSFSDDGWYLSHVAGDTSYDVSDAVRRSQILALGMPARLVEYVGEAFRGDGACISSDAAISYARLESLPAASCADDGTGSFMVVCSDLTHSPCDVLADSWRLDFKGDGERDDYEDTHAGFGCNAATYVALADWFDWMREVGVYDNTRIIIVSDHGFDYGIADNVADSDLEISDFRPVLLVKDFDSHGFSVDERMMSNADVPAIATDGLIEDAANPFTGERFRFFSEAGDEAYMLAGIPWNTGDTLPTTFDMSGHVWVHVKDDVRDSSNYAVVDDDEVEEAMSRESR